MKRKPFRSFAVVGVLALGALALFTLSSSEQQGTHAPNNPRVPAASAPQSLPTPPPSPPLLGPIQRSGSLAVSSESDRERVDPKVILRDEAQDPNHPEVLYVRQVVRGNSKYPLVRTEEVISRGRVISRTSFVADHLIVGLAPTKTKSDLTGFLSTLPEALEAKIRAQIPYSDLYLIEFKVEDFVSLDHIRDALSTSGITTPPERDFIVRAR